MIIENNVINEIIINKSKFITYLYKVNNKEEINNYLDKLKKEYKDATHICYAYIINNEIKYNDDNEPTGTAGIPILEVLKKNNLNYIVCFVIRYFGGIKLGSGGLVRAYSNSCSNALKLTNIIEYKKLYKIKLNISYTDNNILEKIINEKNILEKNFNDNINYILLVDEETLDIINSYKFIYEIEKES